MLGTGAKLHYGLPWVPVQGRRACYYCRDLRVFSAFSLGRPGWLCRPPQLGGQPILHLRTQWKAQVSLSNQHYLLEWMHSSTCADTWWCHKKKQQQHGEVIHTPFPGIDFSTHPAQNPGHFQSNYKQSSRKVNQFIHGHLDCDKSASFAYNSGALLNHSVCQHITVQACMVGCCRPALHCMYWVTALQQWFVRLWGLSPFHAKPHLILSRSPGCSVFNTSVSIKHKKELRF